MLCVETVAEVFCSIRSPSWCQVDWFLTVLDRLSQVFQLSFSFISCDEMVADVVEPAYRTMD